MVDDGAWRQLVLLPVAPLLLLRLDEGAIWGLVLDTGGIPVTEHRHNGHNASSCVAVHSSRQREQN